MTDQLQTLTLTEPVWVGPWVQRNPFSYRRMVLFPLNGQMPHLAQSNVWQHVADRWDFDCGERGKLYVRGSGYPTPEAAQAACEKAILDAWRNR